jgi:hypothetical protein
MDDSLLDRFLFFNFNKDAKIGENDAHEIVDQIFNGISRSVARKKYLNQGEITDHNRYQRSLFGETPSDKIQQDAKQRILDTIIWLYAISTQSENAEYNDVRHSLYDMFELISMSSEGNNVYTSYSLYKNSCTQIEPIIKYIINKLDITILKPYNGNDRKYIKRSVPYINNWYCADSGSITGLNSSAMIIDSDRNYTLKSVIKIIHEFFGSTPAEISCILELMKSIRNNADHNEALKKSYETNPQDWFERIKFLLYDLITVVFALREAICERAKSNDIFKQYEKKFQDIVNQHKIHISLIYEVNNENRDDKFCIGEHKPDPVDAPDGKSKKSVFELNRKVKSYKLRAEKKDGETVDFNVLSYYDGCTIKISLPTKESPSPNIENIISNNALIPDGALKQFICKNIDKQGIKDDISKCVKVILGLTSGDKKTVTDYLNKLVVKSQVLSDKSASDNSELIKSVSETSREYKQQNRKS